MHGTWVNPPIDNEGRAGNALRWIVLGGLVAGLLDLLFAFAFWWFAHGIGPVGILHSIAAGWLGRPAAYAGGSAAAVLGAVSHFGIAIVMAAVFWLAARSRPILARYPWRAGAGYGVILFVVMNYVVVPLSAIGPRYPAWQPTLLLHLAVHMLLVGVPCALAARRAIFGTWLSSRQ